MAKINQGLINLATPDAASWGSPDDPYNINIAGVLVASRSNNIERPKLLIIKQSRKQRKMPAKSRNCIAGSGSCVELRMVMG